MCPETMSGTPHPVINVLYCQFAMLTAQSTEATQTPRQADGQQEPGGARSNSITSSTSISCQQQQQ